MRKKVNGIFNKFLKLLYVTAYFSLVAVLIAQALTPGNTSAELSGAVGDKLDRLLTDVKSPQGEVVNVSGVQLESVDIDGKKSGKVQRFEMPAGGTAKLVFGVIPLNATNKSLKISSSDTAVCEVDGSGEAVAKKPGKCVITATSCDNENLTAEVEVKVNEVKPAKLTVNVNEKLYVGQTVIAECIISPADATYKQITWKSSDEGVLKVNSEGEVTALGEGSADIIAASTLYPSVTGKAEIIVKNEPQHPIEITDVHIPYTDSVNVYEGNHLILNATTEPENAHPSELVWTSSDESVAAVDQQGAVDFFKGGKVRIRVTSVIYGVYDEIEFTVLNRLPTNLEFVSNDLEIYECGGYYSAYMKVNSCAVIKLLPLEIMSQRNVFYMLSNACIAQISDEGLIYSYTSGTVQILAIADNEAEAILSVLILYIYDDAETTECEGVTIDGYYMGDSYEELTGEELNMHTGDTAHLSFGAFPSGAAYNDCKVTSSNSSVVRTTAGGMLSAVGSGEAEITVALYMGDQIKAWNTVRVRVTDVPVDSIELNNIPTNIIKGMSAVLSATVLPYNATNREIAWATSDESVIKLEGDKMFAVGLGQATITAECQGLTSSAEVEVLEEMVKITSLTVDGDGEMKLFKGATASLNVEYLPVDATEVSVEYKSANAKIASVSDKGVITANSVGTTEITVFSTNDTSICATMKITVCEKLSSFIKLILSGIKNNDNVYEMKAFTGGKVTPSLEDGSTITKVTFTSSDENVATIGEDGVIAALNAGKTIITALTTDGIETITSSFELTVLPLTFKDTIENFSYFVRKSIGHFGAFAMLGFFGALMFIALTSDSPKGKALAFICSLLSGFAVAGLTEIFQLPIFTAGRYCSFADVMLDFTGYLLATLIGFGIAAIASAIKRARQRRAAKTDGQTER